MKNKFYIVLWATAILLAISSAFYSVFGLSKLFSGAVVAIIVVSSVLELSKIVIATYIHDYWKTSNLLLKMYLTFALVCLMCITSMGVYGFLTSAYQTTISDFKRKEIEIQKMDFKIENFKQQTVLLSENELEIQKKLASLQGIQSNQDKTISTIYSSSQRKNTTLLERNIQSVNLQYEKTSQQLEQVQLNKNKLLDSINVYENKKIELLSNNELSEAGPLIYISNALSISMDSVVNYLVLLIMFVFDPLAMALVFAAISIRKTNNFDNTEKNVILSEINEDVMTDGELSTGDHFEEEDVKHEQPDPDITPQEIEDEPKYNRKNKAS